MMNFKIKENKNRIFLILLTILLISGWFYWYELRPAKIRQDCSWVKHTTEAIPAKPAMNEEELKVGGLIKDCSGKRTKSSGEVTGIYESIFNEDKSTCESKNRQIIEEYKTVRPEIPAKDWWEPATPKQYEFCLHDKGL